MYKFLVISCVYLTRAEHFTRAFFHIIRGLEPERHCEVRLRIEVDRQNRISLSHKSGTEVHGGGGLSSQFAIGALLRFRSHCLLLTGLPPRFITHRVRFGSAPVLVRYCDCFALMGNTTFFYALSLYNLLAFCVVFQQIDYT